MVEFTTSSNSNTESYQDINTHAAASVTIPASMMALALLENANQKSIMGLADNIDNNILSDTEILTRNRTVVVVDGDLSCLKNGFRPAPDVQNADIKYIR